APSLHDALPIFLEVVGAVGVGGAVHVGGTGLLEGFEVLARVVLRAVEHQVLEQVREAAAAGRLVLAAHAVPDVDRDDRRLVVLVHDHRQAVGQGERRVGELDLRGGLGGVADDQHRRDAAGDGGGQGEAEEAGAGRQEGGQGHGHSCAGVSSRIVPASYRQNGS